MLPLDEGAVNFPLLAIIAQREVAPSAARLAAPLVDAAIVQNLPPRYRQAVEHATDLYRFHEHKPGVGFGPVFQPMLASFDEASKGLLKRAVGPHLGKRVRRLRKLAGIRLC